MKNVYIYYENYFKKITPSTSIFIQVFNSYENAYKFMLLRKEDFLKLPDHQLDKYNDGNKKSWLRINFKDNYVDLIIESKDCRDI